MKRYVISFAAMCLTICVIIAWSTYSRYQSFFAYHTVIAEHATQTVARNIDDLIAKKERYTRILIEQQKQLLASLINNPDSEHALEQLTRSVREYFPDYFTYTIVDQDGSPLLEDIESLVGPVCLQDLHRFMRTGVQKPRVHPSPHAYHFDIATPFKINRKQYIFFISYHTSLLGKILRASEAHDHYLYLAMSTPNDRYLLEATDKGGRDMETRESYLLSNDEISRTLYQRVIPNTRWTVFDAYTQTLYSSFMGTLLRDAMIYFGTFILVISILGFYLYRAEQRKRIAEKHKDEFLSVISHELRTPLTAIAGSLSLLQNLKEHSDDRKEHLFKIAISNTSKLTMLVNDILDLQKMESGKMDYHMAPLQLVEMLNEAINDIQGYASEARTHIESRFSEHSELLVMGDKSRLMQVMYNLLSNAIKYGAEQDIIIVTIETLDDNMVRVNIIDHGEDIPEEFRERIFEKFSQADSSNTRKLSGSGLGLTIVKSIVVEHHGRVGYTSEENSGSCFYFDLPLIN